VTLGPTYRPNVTLTQAARHTGVSHMCYSHENSCDTAPNLPLLTKLATGEPMGYEVEVEELRGCGKQLVRIGTDTADVKLAVALDPLAKAMPGGRVDRAVPELIDIWRARIEELSAGTKHIGRATLAAAERYLGFLAATFAGFHGANAATHAAVLPRPRLLGALGRVVTLPGLSRLVASGWSLYWNDLLDGSRPSWARTVATAAYRATRAATARHPVRRTVEESLHPGSADSR
jgi:hypothetical protein